MEIPRHWRLRAQRYRLAGSLCLQCGQASFPPRLVCPHCSNLQEREAGGARLVLPLSEHQTIPLTPERIPHERRDSLPGSQPHQVWQQAILLHDQIPG